MIYPTKRVQLNVEEHINIVPYIDVMLVLLVIFMIASPIIEQNFDIDLPNANLSNANAKPVNFAGQHTTVSIYENGDYFINSTVDDTPERLSPKKIAGRVQARLQAFPNMKVFVRGDKAAKYGTVIELIAFLEQNGVEKVGLITEALE